MEKTRKEKHEIEHENLRLAKDILDQMQEEKRFDIIIYGLRPGFGDRDHL
jgi:hypothetical protein